MIYGKERRGEKGEDRRSIDYKASDISSNLST